MSMQYLVFEFDNEATAREVADKLWKQHNVSGELSLRPVSGGRWRMEITSETDLRESTLEKYAAYRVESGD